jgi:O-succinylbenzoic acid--CoA ligase
LKDNLLNNFFSFSNHTDLIAIVSNNHQLTYKELFDQSKTIVGFLGSKQIKKNDYAPILIEDQFYFIKTIIGLWYLGAIPVVINSKLLEKEIISIIEDYGFNLLISDKHISKELNQIENIKIDFHQLLHSEDIYSDISIPNNDDEAVVIFTSGTSGRPKGVVHTFSSLIKSIENGNQILMHQEKDRWLASLPFYHIGGFQILCRSLYYGCTIVLPESLKTDDLVTAITKLNPTHISLVSAQLQKFIYLGMKASKSVRITLVGGGFVDDELMFEAEKLGWKPYRVYGSSETASMVTAISANEILSKPQSVGKPLNNVKIKISDDSEILIKSNSLFTKYLGDEKETSSKLINAFYHSGDLGFVDDDGYLFIEARRNDLIVTGGENVNPIEVEKAILHIVGIRDVCVFAKQDKTWGQIVACAIVKEDNFINEKMIKEILKQQLAGYKIPKQFFFTDILPRTSVGKLEREKIKKMF